MKLPAYTYRRSARPGSCETLRKYVSVNAVDEVGEYSSGMYAAYLQKEAVIAISGTGSGVFYVRGKDAGYGVGGWGALISDEGSGYYLDGWRRWQRSAAMKNAALLQF